MRDNLSAFLGWALPFGKDVRVWAKVAARCELIGFGPRLLPVRNFLGGQLRA